MEIEEVEECHSCCGDHHHEREIKVVKENAVKNGIESEGELLNEVKGEQRDKGNVHIDARIKGAELYKQGDIDGAIECWSKGLRTLQFILNKKDEFANDATSTEDFQNKWNFYVTSYIKIASNMSLAFMKKGQHAECIKYCENVMRYDCENLKAFLRITQANMELGNFSKALEHCDSGLDVYPDNTELKQLKKKVMERERDYDNEQKDLMKSIFDRMDHDPRSLRGPDPSLVILLFEEAVEGIKRVVSSVFKFIRKSIKTLLAVNLWAKFKKA